MQGDPKSDAPEAVKPEGVTPDSVTLDKQPTGPVQPVAQAYQQPAPQAAQQAYRQPAPQAAQTYQQPAPQQAQAYQQPAPNAYRGYQQPAPQQAYRNYQQPQPPYQQPPRQAQPAYQQPAPQNYRQPAPNYAAQPGSTDFESVITGLRNRKLRRLGMILIFTWLALVIGALTLFLGALASGSTSASAARAYSSSSPYLSISMKPDFWTVFLGILVIFFTPVVLLLFEYGGFSFSYEGRRFPSSLFTGTRVFVIIVIPAIALIASKADLSGLSFNGASTTGVMAIIGMILLAVGFVANTILFYIYSFTSAQYNGKGFMVTGLIFAIMQILGILLFLVALFIEGLGMPWWGYIGLGISIIGFCIQCISYVIGYAPARDGVSRFGGGPAGGYRAY